MADISTSVESAGSMLPHRHVLTLCTRLSYSVGHVLNDLCASMWFSYLLVYQHLVLQFSNKIAGALLLIGQVADAVSTPFVGIESDRQDDFWLCKYGRRKTWHLIGTVCVIGSFPFLFMECVGCSKSSQNAQFVYYAAFIIIFQFGWAAVQISHLSLIPDLTPISSERVELNALRYAMTVMSNICVYSFMWVVLGTNKTEEIHVNPKDASIFKEVALSTVGIGSFFSVVFHVFVKEVPHVPYISTDGCLIQRSIDSTEGIPHLRWKEWFKQPQFYMVALLYMGTRLYVNLSQVYLPLYIQDSLKLSKDKIAIIPLVVYLSGFLTSFLMKYLSKRAGNKKSYFLGCILAIGATVWLYVGKGKAFCTAEIYGVAFLIGSAGSTMLIISLSITSDLIGNNTSSGAFVFGAMSFIDKLSNGLAVIIIQDLHPCISCCSHCQWYYEYVLVFASTGAIFLALLALALLGSHPIGVKRKEGLTNNNPANIVQCENGDIKQKIISKRYSNEDVTPLLCSEDSESEDIIA